MGTKTKCFETSNLSTFQQSFQNNIFSQVLIHNSKKYREEFWNRIRGWIRFEQYRKVYVYDKGSPNSVLGSISSNFCNNCFVDLEVQGPIELCLYVCTLNMQLLKLAAFQGQDRKATKKCTGKSALYCSNDKVKSPYNIPLDLQCFKFEQAIQNAGLDK